MNVIRFCCIIIFLFLPRHMHAQDNKVISDLRLWSGIKLEKDFSKDWNLSIEEEIRFKNNISEINNIFTELELRYRINRNFSLGAGYRHTMDNKPEDGYTAFSRAHMSLRFKGRLENITLYYRLKYQREVESAMFFKSEAPFVKQFRNRVMIRSTHFDIAQPYASIELLNVYSPNLIPLEDYYRLQAGIRIQTKGFGEYKLAWGFNRELGVEPAAMIYMLRVNCIYAL